MVTGYSEGLNCQPLVVETVNQGAGFYERLVDMVSIKSCFGHHVTSAGTWYGRTSLAEATFLPSPLLSRAFLGTPDS